MTRCKVENVAVPSAARNWLLSIAADAEEGEIVKCFVMRPDTLAPVCSAVQDVVSENNMAKFGFVYKFAVDKQTQQLGLRVFSGGTHKTMLVAPDAKIDGEQYASAAEAKAELDRLYPQEENMYWDDSEYGAFSMLFLTNEMGQITYIDTPEKGYRESEYTLRLNWFNNSSGFKKYIYNTDTAGDYINLDSTQQYIDSDADVLHVEGLMNSYNKFYSFKADRLISKCEYNFLFMTTQGPNPKNQRIAYIMAKGFQRDVSPTAVHDRQMFVVSETAQTIGNDGERTLKLTGLMEGAQREYIIDSDYFKMGLYNDVWAFRDDGVFSAYYDPDSDTYAEGIVESETRKTQIFLPGDIIRLELHDRTGEVIKVTPTFLSDARVFKADDVGRFTDKNRYRAFDLAVVKELGVKYCLLTYLIDKRQSAGSQATAVVHVNKDGFVVSATNSLGFTNTLYDEVNQDYFFTAYFPYGLGMRDDELLDDMSKFKIMVYDESRPMGDRVYVGSDADLNDTVLRFEPASLVIMQFRGSTNGLTNPRGMVILKLYDRS